MSASLMVKPAALASTFRVAGAVVTVMGTLKTSVLVSLAVL